MSKQRNKGLLGAFSRPEYSDKTQVPVLVGLSFLLAVATNWHLLFYAGKSLSNGAPVMGSHHAVDEHICKPSVTAMGTCCLTHGSFIVRLHILLQNEGNK